VAVISATLMVLLYFQAALYTRPSTSSASSRIRSAAACSHIIEQNAPHRTFDGLSPGIYPRVAV